MIRLPLRLDWIALLSLLLAAACSNEVLYPQETYSAAVRTATRSAVHLAAARAGQSTQLTQAWATSQPTLVAIDYQDKAAEDRAAIIGITGLVVIMAFTVILLVLVWVYLDHRKRMTQLFRRKIAEEHEAQMMQPPPADED